MTLQVWTDRDAGNLDGYEFRTDIMKDSNVFSGIVAVSAGMVALCGCSDPEETMPDILFILVDDMQKQSIAFFGNPDVHTPNIDRIMSEAVVFDHAYTNGALCGALSMPSRAMIMTGRHVFEVQSDGMVIPDCHVTFPEHFRSMGYRTFATGKWHSDKASFNRSFSEGENIFFGGMHPYEKGGHAEVELHHYDSTGRYGVPFVADRFSSEMFADAAVDFLGSVKHDRTPYVAYVAFTSPHDPRNILPEYGERYLPDTLTLPGNFLPSHPFDNGDLDIRDEMVLPPPRTEAGIRNEMALYYGMVSEVDVQIGRVLDALERTGRKDNTILVFASDNGLAMGRNGLLGKQSLYEHSVGVPLAIADFRKEDRHHVSDALCYLSDIFPTLCSMAGIEVPTSVTSMSLRPVIEGETGQVRDDIFLAYSNQQRAVVKDGYKYVIYNVGGQITEQLFDLAGDPGEMDNLAEVFPDRTIEMNGLLGERMEEAGDFCDLSDHLWWKDGHKLEWEELTKLYVFE